MESLRTPCEGAHFEHVRGCSNKHAVRLRRQRRRSPTAPLMLCWDAQVTHIIAVWTQWSVDCTCTCRDLSRSVISLYRYRFYCPSTAFERVVFFFFYFFVSLHSRLLHSFAFPLVSLASIKDLRGLKFWNSWLYTCTRLHVFYKQTCIYRLLWNSVQRVRRTVLRTNANLCTKWTSFMPHCGK